MPSGGPRGAFDSTGDIPMKSPMTFEDRKKKEAKKTGAMMNTLYKVSFVSIFFIIAQLIGGYISGSIAIFADTAHLASDMMGFVIAMLGVKLAERRADKHLSYGWHRAELVGTLVSVVSIWVMTVWLIVAATERFFIPPQVVGKLMFIVAVVGLIFNLIQIKILHGGEDHFHLGGEIHGEGGCGHDHGHAGHKHGEGEACSSEEKKAQACSSEAKDEKKEEDDHEHTNMNMTAATLHVLGDMLSSVGVIIASIFIYIWPSVWFLDPICTYIFAILVTCTTIPVFRKLLDVMMEATPSVIATWKNPDTKKNEDLGIDNLKVDILTSHTSICEVHDLHVWSLGGGKKSMTCHITSHNPPRSLKKVTNMLRTKYKLFHTSVQAECTKEDENKKANPNFFDFAQDVHDDERQYADEHKAHQH